MGAVKYDRAAALDFTLYQLRQNPRIRMADVRQRATVERIAHEASKPWWGSVYTEARKILGLTGQRVEAVDLPEPPPIDYDALTREEQVAWNWPGARRLAADLLANAWTDAGKRPSSRKDNSIHAPSLRIRYAQAWLQTPKLTAPWCGLLGVDPDELARLSRLRHGVPSFTPEEIDRLLQPEAIVP